MAEGSGAGRLTGEAAIVTGGGQGIGQAIARRLSEDGAAVAILDLNVETGQATAAALSTAGGRAIFVQCDVRRRPDVRAAVDRVAQSFGGVTILVNNAGIGRRAPFLELSDETWNAVLEVNLTGAFIVAQEVCRHMARAGRGSVVDLRLRRGPYGAQRAGGLFGEQGGVGGADARDGVRTRACRGQSERGVYRARSRPSSCPEC